MRCRTYGLALFIQSVFRDLATGFEGQDHEWQGSRREQIEKPPWACPCANRDFFTRCCGGW